MRAAVRELPLRVMSIRAAVLGTLEWAATTTAERRILAATGPVVVVAVAPAVPRETMAGISGLGRAVYSKTAQLSRSKQRSSHFLPQCPALPASRGG
jgi:hypothetical protein